MLPRTRPPRFLLYSHDSVGLGHLRRSLNVARRLTEAFEGSGALIASGSPCATHFPLPPNVDVVKLPSVGKGPDGGYVPRSLPEPLERVIGLRRSLLETLYADYAPDLVLVDHRVTGLHGEAIGLLERARSDRTPTVLGLRDVIDAPERVARQWDDGTVRWALSEGYERVCVYGSRDVFDTRAAYPFPPGLDERLEFVGYVVSPEAQRRPDPIPDLKPEVLLTTGGGEDGERRVAAYLDCLRLSPPHWRSTVVLGPMLSPEAARRSRMLARGLENVEVHDFLPDLPARMARSDAVVSMAGYNTVAELLSVQRPAVLLPRREPRVEQLFRAEALHRLGLATQADERDVEGLRVAVERSLESSGVRASRTRPSLEGLDGVCRVAGELLDREPRTGALVGGAA